MRRHEGSECLWENASVHLLGAGLPLILNLETVQQADQVGLWWTRRAPKRRDQPATRGDPFSRDEGPFKQ